MSRARQLPTVRLRRLAAELRQLRAAAGMTREEVAEQTKINTATLYRIEAAKAKPQVRTLVALLAAYGASEEQANELQALLRESGERGWLNPAQDLPEPYSHYISFEREAAALHNYESLFVPGLLQTEEYARSVIRGVLPTATKDQVEHRVEARMQRQAVLERLSLWAVVDEAALRRLVGSPATMRSQLQRLHDVAEEPNVTLQVVPYHAGAHPGMPGSFVIMRFEEPNTDLIYIDSMAGDLFLEEPPEVERYKMVFDHLRAMAASPEATRRMVAKIKEELK